MNMLDLLVLVAAGAAVVAYVCRLNALQWRLHSPAIIVMHAGLAIACVVSGVHAWEGDAGVLEVSSVIGAGAWIVLSLPTWKKGHVPTQFEKTQPMPMPLSAEEAEHVAGGKQ